MFARSVIGTNFPAKVGFRNVVALVIAMWLFTSYEAVAADGDISLYREIASEVKNGESYYEAAAQLHREHNYPLRPFVTVRSPALAQLHAFLNPTGVFVTAWALLFLALGAWWRTLQSRPFLEKTTALCLIAAGGGAMFSVRLPRRPAVG